MELIILVITISCFHLVASITTPNIEEINKLDGKYGFIEISNSANMFYWFYESENTKPDTPLILFVPGGPGISGTMFDSFLQTGPQDWKLKRRKRRWTKEAHLLYIDAPANSGFSYYKKGNYSTSNADDISQQIYEFFKSFLQKYPTYQDVPIHIYGHSFGGTVTPRLAKKIIEGSTNGHFPPIDLKGVVLSAPLVSAVEVIQTYPDYLFAMNMVTSKLFRKITDRAAVYVRATEATPRNNTEIVQSFYDMISLYSGNINANDLLDCGTYPGYSRGLEVQNLLRSLKFNEVIGHPDNESSVYSDIVRDNHLGNALSTNATSHVSYLLSSTNVKVSVMTAQMDLLGNSLGTYKWIDNLDWSDLSKFMAADMKIIGPHANPMATKKSYGRFAVYGVLAAGHEIPMYQPEAAFTIMQEFLK